MFRPITFNDSQARHGLCFPPISSLILQQCTWRSCFPAGLCVEHKAHSLAAAFPPHTICTCRVNPWGISTLSNGRSLKHRGCRQLRGYTRNSALEKKRRRKAKRERQSLYAPWMGQLRSACSALHSSPVRVGSRGLAGHKAAIVKQGGGAAREGDRQEMNTHSLCGCFQPPM